MITNGTLFVELLLPGSLSCEFLLYRLLIGFIPLVNFHFCFLIWAAEESKTYYKLVLIQLS